jgi:hypothetical protein
VSNSVDGALQLKLCSDTLGVTAVNTINIPPTGVVAAWLPITVDTGGALGSAIQSIALYVVTDNGAQGINLDNIIACKAPASADSLSLQSLIGKNTAGETFWPIQAINGTLVMLDGDTSFLPNNSSKAFSYFGASETVTTYKRETFKTAPATSTTQAIMTVQEAGTAANRNTVSGGWNSTDMSTQTLQTWFDGLNSLGNGLTSKNYVDCSNINLVRYQSGFLSAQVASTYSGETIAACSVSGVWCDGPQCNITLEHSLFNSDSTLDTYSTVDIGEVLLGTINMEESNNITIGAMYGNGSQIDVALSFNTARNNKVYVDTIKYATYGIWVPNLSIGNHLYNAVISDSVTADVSIGDMTSDYTQTYLHNCTLSSATQYTTPVAGYENHSGIYSTGQDGDIDKHIQKLSNGNIASEPTIRHTASGISWKMSPTSTTYVTSAFPFELTVARIAVTASTLVTVNLWMRRSNTGITGRLMCRGRQIAGVSADVYADITAIADTWEEVTITFTPTAKGVVEILAQCFGGTTYSVYVDDFSYTQA